METLKGKLEFDLKTAMKSKDMVVVSVLRLVLAGIKNREIEERGAGKLKHEESLDDASVVRLLTTFVKQRNESIDMFKKGGREDLIKKETLELEIISRYLPTKLSEAQVEKLVEDTIKEMGAANSKDMGRVMKAVMAKASGQADGKLISDIVRRKLP